MTSEDIVRDLALALESMERSPPEPLILGLEELAGRLNVSQGAVARAFERLDELDLIEGPGPHEDAWIFRRLTPRGRLFVEEVRYPKQWRAIKSRYDPPQSR
jgi:DNA-binding MarR family transcriptional regulator